MQDMSSRVPPIMADNGTHLPSFSSGGTQLRAHNGVHRHANPAVVHSSSVQHVRSHSHPHSHSYLHAHICQCALASSVRQARSSVQADGWRAASGARGPRRPRTAEEVAAASWQETHDTSSEEGRGSEGRVREKGWENASSVNGQRWKDGGKGIDRERNGAGSRRGSEGEGSWEERKRDSNKEWELRG